MKLGKFIVILASLCFSAQGEKRAKRSPLDLFGSRNQWSTKSDDSSNNRDNSYEYTTTHSSNSKKNGHTSNPSEYTIGGVLSSRHVEDQFNTVLEVRF